MVAILSEALGALIAMWKVNWSIQINSWYWAAQPMSFFFPAEKAFSGVRFILIERSMQFANEYQILRNKNAIHLATFLLS
jgi:hypothetical protein